MRGKEERKKERGGWEGKRGEKKPQVHNTFQICGAEGKRQPKIAFVHMWNHPPLSNPCWVPLGQLGMNLNSIQEYFAFKSLVKLPFDESICITIGNFIFFSQFLTCPRVKTWLIFPWYINKYYILYKKYIKIWSVAIHWADTHKI